MKYYEYNREERAICSHLFRLLHKNLNSDYKNSGLFSILKLLISKNSSLQWRGEGIKDVKGLDFSNVGIYAEVALIRDAYHIRKPNIELFMDKLVEIVKKQEEVDDCRLFSQLPGVLKNPFKTHPIYIRRKAKNKNISLSTGEQRVYGAIQGYFKAKPDLAIVIDNYLLVFEAKFTQTFDSNQIERTKKIADIWSSEILYEDLGFKKRPSYTVLKLGSSNLDVDLTWKDILKVANKYYKKDDKSIIALKNGVELLNGKL